MSAVIRRSDGKGLDFDHAFEDPGKPPVMGMMGGQKTVFELGTPPKPSIYQRGDGFFTKDGAPITEEIAAPWFEDKAYSDGFKAKLRRFLDRCKAGKSPKDKPTKLRIPKRPLKREIVLTAKDIGLDQPERV